MFVNAFNIFFGTFSDNNSYNIKNNYYKINANRRFHSSGRGATN